MKMWTDGQTDGHINLIGGLVTHNPPKNKSCRLALFNLLLYLFGQKLI